MKTPSSPLPTPNSQLLTPNNHVAIVADWLVGIGGAERVVLELHKMYPDAPIYTSQYDPKSIDWFKNADVRTLWLQKLPKGLKKFLPVLRAWAFSRLDLSQYDLVISSSGAEAKFIRTKPIKRVRSMQAAVAQGADEQQTELYKDSTAKEQRRSQRSDTAASTGGTDGSAGRQAGALHVSYVHAPTHYYWDRYDEYIKNPGFGAFDWLARLGLKILVGPMRKWDYRAAQRPDFLIANSTHTQKMIKKYYARDSEVVYPPVETDRFKTLTKSTRVGFVSVGRQTPYKKIDLAVGACSKLNLPLTVIGNGPDHDKLVKMAGSSIKFIERASDEEIAQHMQTAKAFIFPGLDDFGIVAVEALAAGTPVIAFKAGGALDYVNEKTGLFFEDQTVESLEKALKDFDPKSFDSQKIQAEAQKFSPENFQKKVSSLIKSLQ